MASDRDADLAAPPDGLSAFGARVLDQLSLSAWLPGALLAGSVTLLTALRTNNFALGKALDELAKNPWPALVLSVPVLVLATLLTQAFSFDAIRALEGYWQPPGPLRWCAVLGTRLRVRHRARLERRRAERAAGAFKVARGRMEAAGKEAWLIDALERDALEQSPPKLDDVQASKLARHSWRTRCDPWDLAAIDRLDAKRTDYPVPSRVLPTKLGNVIRSTEDHLALNGSRLEDYALDRRDATSPRVRITHDQFRTRLDMYAMLVFVASALAVATAPILLAGRDPQGVDPAHYWATAAIAVGYATTAIANYAAAISSARGYCWTLRKM